MTIPQPIITDPFIAGWLWGLFTGGMGAYAMAVSILTLRDILRGRSRT